MEHSYKAIKNLMVCQGPMRLCQLRFDHFKLHNKKAHERVENLQS